MTFPPDKTNPKSMHDPAFMNLPFFGKGFRDTPIKQKLTYIILSTTLLALVVSSIIFLIFDITTYRTSMVQRLALTAEMTSANLTASVAFKDPESAQQILSSLSSDDHILCARVTLSDGTPFAHYTSPKHLEVRDIEWNTLRDRKLSLWFMLIDMPIVLNSEQLGTLSIRHDMNEFWIRLLMVVATAFFAALMGISLALFISARFQKAISDPILDLAITARKVSQTNDYSLRAIATTRDEIGTLITYFNEMLLRIQESDGAIRSAKDQLELKVEERTADLRNEIKDRLHIEEQIKVLLWRIQEDNEKLQRLDTAKNDFLSTVSHELRTPLTAILGFLKLVIGGQAGSLTPMQSDFVQTSLTNANRLYQLVNDLLDMTRLESGIIQLDRKEVLASRVIATALRSVSSLSTQKSIQLTSKVDETLKVELDAEKFEQVLLNLLSNAIKFTNQGGFIETGAKKHVDNDKEGVVFWVKDTGIGIPKDSAKKVFEKFYQVENHLTRKVGGTGLGLAITKRIVEAHGGRVWLESEENKGTTFFCFIPHVKKTT